MKVSGGGYFLRTERQQEESYGLVVNFKSMPAAAKYLIADFELPNNSGVYERKIFPVTDTQSSLLVNSNPIYGIKYGSL